MDTDRIDFAVRWIDKYIPNHTEWTVLGDCTEEGLKDYAFTIWSPDGAGHKFVFPLNVTEEEVWKRLSGTYFRDTGLPKHVGFKSEIIREVVIEDVLKERLRQVSGDLPWDTEFDDKNTINDWITYIARYAGQAGFAGKDCDKTQRYWLVQTAAICIAAIEAGDRNDGFPNRHYDKPEFVVKPDYDENSEGMTNEC